MKVLKYENFGVKYEKHKKPTCLKFSLCSRWTSLAGSAPIILGSPKSTLAWAALRRALLDSKKELLRAEVTTSALWSQSEAGPFRTAQMTQMPLRRRSQRATYGPVNSGRVWWMEAVTRQQREGLLNYTVYTGLLFESAQWRALIYRPTLVLPVFAFAPISHANEMLRGLLRAGKACRWRGLSCCFMALFVFPFPA